MKKSVELLWALHHKVEPTGFRMAREKGQNAVLFLHFLTPAMVVIEGVEITVARNACIVYTPGVRHDYGAVSESAGYENNFVTFSTDASEFFAYYKVPTNEPFYINNADEITHIVSQITWAAASREEFLDNEISMHIFELFAQLEKGMTITAPKSQRDAQIRQRFIAIKGEIRVNPKVWTVQKMAAACWLTRSRFYVLYKSFFGVSPSDDLAAATLDFAKERLLNSGDSVAKISADCGYKRVECFIRMFSEKEGTTPGQFRKTASREKNNNI